MPSNFYGFGWSAQPHVTYTSTVRPHGADTMRSFDSTSPVFLAIDGVPVLLWVHFSRHVGPSLTKHYDAINETLEELGSAYRLDPLDLEADTFGLWAAHNNIEGDPAADPDEDGVSNLYEYGLGGDPNDPLSRGGLPTLSVLDGASTNQLQLTHARRIGIAQQLEWQIAEREQLTDSSWSNLISVADNIETNATGFERVSRRFDSASESAFYKVEIELP
jgi:hypothetical protein